MKILFTLKRSLLFIAPLVCLTACYHRSDVLDKWSDTDAEFDISKEATIIDEQGVKRKLSDVVVSDSTFVIRVTDKQPEESRTLVLYRARFFTDNYPRTDNIIILADESPADTNYLSKWSDALKACNAKMRVYKIEENVLSPRLENGQRAYVFFLDKQLHADGIFMPTDKDKWSLRTLQYFSNTAAILGRSQTDPLITDELERQASRPAGSNTNTSGITFWDQNAKVGERTVRSIYFEEFTFRNKGNEPLIIGNVVNNWDGPNCCVYIPETPVRPGYTCKIRVYYRPQFRGYFKNRIELYTNISDEPLIFNIKGTAVKASANKGVSWLETVRKTKIIGMTSYVRF